MSDYLPEVIPARDEDAPPERWTDDWYVAHAVSLRTGEHDAEMARLRAQIDEMTDEAFARIYGPDRGLVSVERDYGDRHLRDGAAFVLDADVTIKPRVGIEDRVLWPEGEAMMICSPPGVGKTTLALQIVSASIGIDDPEILGLPVAPARRVLYLAMDRPKQIVRAMRRLWTDEHRDLLAERLAVWSGPLPFDLADDAYGLLELARRADADVIVIDSLKDAAVQLTDDRTAGMVNRAIQTCLAEGVDVLALHHQRKGQNGEKPKRLEDVYGSTWITAGMGSVALLWGAAGDPLVELVHLKQPSSEIGPWTLEHDHNIGRTSIYRGFDLERFIASHPNGVTTIDVARAMTEKSAPNDNERKKAQRQLDAAVKRGRLAKRDAVLGGSGGAIGARYFRAETALLEAS